MLTSLKKSTSEKYLLKFDSPSCMWAEITIDEDGTFNAQSDNGNFQYSWRHHGRESFKHFIQELARDSHYFLGKVAEKEYFDKKATEQNWKLKVIELREEDYLTKERAREIWNEIPNVISDAYDPTHLAILAYEGDLFKDIEEPWYDFEIYKTYSHGARHFAEVVMPEFAKILLEELKSK